MNTKNRWKSFVFFSMAVTVLAVMTGCGGGGSGDELPGQPPTVTGQVTLSGAEVINVAWPAATDDLTPAADLEYQVVYSTDGNISTVDAAVANGAVAMPWTKNIGTFTIAGLNIGTKYYVAVLVRDQSALISIYPPADRTTEETPLVLTNGGYIQCPSGTVMNGFGGRKGGVIDQLFLQCADEVQPSQAGSVAGAGIGGDGGDPFDKFFCPNGSSVARIKVINGGEMFPKALASLVVTCSDESATSSDNSLGSGTPIVLSCTDPSTKIIGIAAEPSDSEGTYAGFVTNVICR